MIRKNYELYLEALVFSLLAEREDPLKDILSADKSHPAWSFEGADFSPINVIKEITEHRKLRGNIKDKNVQGIQ